MEDRVKALEIDKELVWECLLGYQRNLIKVYSLLHAEIDEIGSMLYRHESSDEVFKNQLSDTHKKYYEKFESVFKALKGTGANAPKRETYTIKGGEGG